MLLSIKSQTFVLIIFFNQKFLFMKSWKTTLAGVFQFLVIALNEFGYLLDTIPETNPNWGLIVASGVTLFGLIQARDNNVSSETAGAK